MSLYWFLFYFRRTKIFFITGALKLRILEDKLSTTIDFRKVLIWFLIAFQSFQNSIFLLVYEKVFRNLDNYSMIVLINIKGCIKPSMWAFWVKFFDQVSLLEQKIDKRVIIFVDLGQHLLLSDGQLAILLTMGWTGWFYAYVCFRIIYH